MNAEEKNQPHQEENLDDFQQKDLESDPSQNNENIGQEKSPVGPLIGIILIIVIMVLGAVFFWTQGETEPTQPNEEPLVEEEISEEEVEEELKEELEELEELEEDLQGLEEELEVIEIEFQEE